MQLTTFGAYRLINPPTINPTSINPPTITMRRNAWSPQGVQATVPDPIMPSFRGDPSGAGRISFAVAVDHLGVVGLGAVTGGMNHSACMDILREIVCPL